MTGTIWIHQARPRPSWYELDRGRQAELHTEWAHLDRHATANGAVWLGSYSIRGQSDYSTLELWRFKTPEEAFNFWTTRVTAGYSTWFAFSNQIGVSTPVPAESYEP